MLAQGGPFLGFITWTSRGINIDLPWNFMKLHVFVVIGPQVLWLERYLASVQFRNGDAIPQLDKLRAARSINNAVKYLQRSCKTEKAQA